MNLPRLTTRGTMFGVALVAANLAARRQWKQDLFLDLVPNLDLLAIATYLAIGRRARRGQLHPFLFGSLAFGWVAALTFALVRLWFYGAIRHFHQQGESALRSFWFDYVAITGVWSNNHWSQLRAFFFWVTGSLPQFLFALLGGGIAWRFGLAWDRGGARSRRTLSKVVVVAGLLSIALVTAAILYHEAEERRATANRHAVGGRSQRSLIPILDRLATEIERDSNDWAAQNGQDPRIEIVKLRALAAEVFRSAERSSDLRRKYERAALRPWWPVAPDPPPSRP